MPLRAKIIPRRRTYLRSFRSLLKVVSATGIVPYSLRGHNIRSGAWKLVLSIFCAFISPFLGCYAILSPSPLLTNALISMIVFLLQYVPYCLSVVAFLFCHIFYRSDIGKANQQLLRIEGMLFLLNAEPKMRCKIWKEAVMPLLVVCCTVVHLNIAPASDFSSVALYVTLEYASFYFFTVESVIIFFLDIIHHYQSLLVHRASDREAVLVQLCRIQDKLMDITASIEKIYGIPLLWMVLGCLCFFNVNTFIVVKRIKDPTVIIVVFWIIIVFILIFRISLACERMKEKVEEFYTVLYRIVKKDKSYKLLNNNYLRAHLLKKKSFSFNLAGFTQVNLNLVAGMISATTTYSVILIQMGKDFH